MQQLRTILLTTDFSETSRKAVPAAKMLAKQFGAKVLLGYVEEDRLPPMVVEYMSVGIEDLLERQQMRAAQRLQEFAKENFEADIEIEQRAVMGTPHVEIVRLAREADVDMIVMATHGRGFISHAVMGSTTERVMRHAPCPVLVVQDRSE
ncbi:MAG: universal stress protein [bacterium]|nr:universal stress protein [bacterium]